MISSGHMLPEFCGDVHHPTGNPPLNQAVERHDVGGLRYCSIAGFLNGDITET